jgi:hypothetical protein
MALNADVSLQHCVVLLGTSLQLHWPIQVSSFLHVPYSVQRLINFLKKLYLVHALSEFGCVVE